MDKSCIITVTQGDFEYIDEWITYHHSIGVDLFLIGFNGKSDEFDKLPKYDYVKYIDFSVNDNETTNNLNAKLLPGFSGWTIDESFNSIENIHKIPLHEKLLNILYKYVLFVFNDIKYTIIIDTDEFIDIKNINYKNISELLSNNFTDDKICLQIIMDMYDDNNNIYYENKPCLERFTHLSNKNENFGLGNSKTIINNFHKDSYKLNILSPHTCLNFDNYNFNFYKLNTNEAKLKHFFTKSLEEWIKKMDYNIDSDYFRRWRGKIFDVYFYWNSITDEKIKAIDNLLLKYNINYDVIKEEPICSFLDAYKDYKELNE